MPQLSSPPLEQSLPEQGVTYSKGRSRREYPRSGMCQGYGCCSGGSLFYEHLEGTSKRQNEWLRGLREEHLVACEYGKWIDFHSSMFHSSILRSSDYPIKEATGSKPKTQEGFIPCLHSLLIVRHLYSVHLGLVWI